MPHRQWSIRAVFEPTWQHLTAKERTIFMKLSLFRGGFTQEAAQAVAGADLVGLKSLTNKALITRHPQGRYNVHELLRPYAQEALAASSDLTVTHSA